MTTYATRLADVHVKINDALAMRRDARGTTVTAVEARDAAATVLSEAEATLQERQAGVSAATTAALEALDMGIGEYQAVSREIVAETAAPPTSTPPPTGG